MTGTQLDYELRRFADWAETISDREVRHEVLGWLSLLLDLRPEGNT
jgi:hypothetical protein